ncbi:hypothetical protein BDP27DRAFT_1393001 [Rhodocollybia butyracea]|uniref:Putative lipoate-protein ligase A n=1 Tax=Rhodocollybia butyracea TaxID=206335 RepID=A0A9P5U664_9AGAR|nr:hypothetical protein BDP27DRAFT_1393001 [Rhodocollybia butyracea]
MLSSRLPWSNFFRLYSTAPTSPQHSIYISNSTNPYFNLSFEDWLFRHKEPKTPLLLLYRDDPCVIIGRNQNPWKEVNLSILHSRKDIPFIRRRSGGGTVYHDLGNTNFSIHLPRSSFDRHKTAQVILRAVRSLEVDAIVNERNDICVGSEKVSGSAYKIVNKRAYHHGTMLISTELNTLGDLLHTTKDAMQTRGVASVRSPVRNLQHFNPSVTHESFVDAVVQAFREEYQCEDDVQSVNEEEYQDLEYIQTGMSELPSWEWGYGQTPEFTYPINETFAWGTASAKIQSKHGIIIDFSLSINSEAAPPATDAGISDENLKSVEKLLQGRRYGSVSAVEIRDALGPNGPVDDIASWLEKSMNS